ncbi:MAG TPA: prepilin-type N-terminal cleavage/methylation domain-containing protein [Candidatus Limnocylindria bacterium]|jgi:prepilin-type N-terminal cleavage/methylation domain-containing protein|nr:prepilin-type N-terminal cleavage/methylation domain-containing protein [Candidatus Limnocylindria bacterium]
MFIGPAKSRINIRNSSGFTLIEIMLAVGILGMMSLAIFRFVQSNMTALYVSSDTAAVDAQYDGLRDLLTAEWQSLTPLRANMIGEPFKLGDRERDEIKWSCRAGPGLLTRYAPEDFTVALRLQPENEKSDRLDLGFLRKPKSDSDIGEGHETWVPLIKNVTSLEISYFNPGVNTWLPRWPARGLPSLIKIKVGRPDAAIPWEAIIPLRRTPY